MNGRSLTVQLLRHGESAANAGQITTDPAEIPLTAAGLVQAEALSCSLVQAPMAIICSPFLRARQRPRPRIAASASPLKYGRSRNSPIWRRPSVSEPLWRSGGHG